ncbi:putative membrane protein [Caenispirillum salinarum AK4]|uniref:Putative membrane protein n=1 Tax=Caenispirillum salinarum AK4 TaxID=1238182 RepID=K9HNH8_9PROT|nr:hypothetical protein [Caenispirillum salinarum]EKV30056.1 putative membrane protein [Caenispirillum salinarum AK4]
MLDTVLAALEASGIATHLRFSRWTYPAVNAGHVLGLALLVGAVVPLDLKLLGLWPAVARRDVERLLAPVAAVGLATAIVTGLLLFSVQARDYASLGLFQAKMALVVLGAANALAALALRRRGGGRPGLEKLLAAVSLLCWPTALAAGRFIGYVI